MTGHLSDKIQSSNSRQLKRKSSCGSKEMVVGLRRALPKGLVLLCLILLAAGRKGILKALHIVRMGKF